MNQTFTDEPEELVFTEGAAAGPPRLLIYGPEKIGKTTFGASSPSPIFIRTEDGAEHIGPARMPLCKTYDQVLSQIEQVRSKKHDRATLVIDSLDWLEKHLFTKVCQQYGVRSIELVEKGFGKGYFIAGEILFELLGQLELLRTVRGMGVILLAHDKTEKTEKPGTPTFDRSVPRVHKNIAGYVKDWADAIGFAYRRIRVSEDESSKGNRNIVHAIGSDRMLCVSDEKSPWCLAGNRYGITEDIPLSWDAFAAKAFS